MNEPIGRLTTKQRKITLAAVEIETAFLKADVPGYVTRGTELRNELGADDVIGGMSNLCAILVKHISTRENINPMEVLYRVTETVKNMQVIDGDDE